MDLLAIAGRYGPESVTLSIHAGLVSPHRQRRSVHGAIARATADIYGHISISSDHHEDRAAVNRTATDERSYCPTRWITAAGIAGIALAVHPVDRSDFH